VSRPRAARLDPEVRRGLIADAAERLLAEHDPWLLTFDLVATEAGVSRALVHAYLGDRRGLVDTVQTRILARLDRWVGHGFDRADTAPARVRALVAGVLSFVEAERDAWGVLTETGGLDHPTAHGIRSRWCAALVADVAGDAGRAEVAAQAITSAVLHGAGGWAARGVDPSEVVAPLLRALEPPAG
jgi:AcrR family transcriptional regulator